MARDTFQGPTNPYHYALHCISGKWKMTLLHEIHTYGKIRFNQTQRVLPVSEKVLSQQLKELIEDGLVQRIVYGSTYPPTIEYVLTTNGERLIPVLDALYVWSVRLMVDKKIPIDEDAFAVHKADKYVDELGDIMDAYDFNENAQRESKHKKRQ